MVAQHVLANFVEVFGNIRNELIRRWVFALNLLEDFDRQLVRINFFCGLGKCILLGF